ncbi:MAG: pyridoxal-phosphate dependent enzyme [Pseudomonadota bacterium]
MPILPEALVNAFPRVPLATLPTPVFAINGQRALDRDAIQRGSSANADIWRDVWVKHDGRCSKLYAGNKVRKLEYLLADAQNQGAQHIVTLGGAGSNHAVATSTYAHHLGMRCTACLSHQPPGAIATLNLRRHVALGTQLYVYEQFRDALDHAHTLAQAEDTVLVPLGGSAPLASLGYVSAAYELATQVANGELPQPERIYVACGTMGTAVGLAIGMTLLDWPTQVVAVRVTERGVASPHKFSALYEHSVALLKSTVPSLPLDATLHPDRVLFVDDFFGTAYAEPTPEALDAIEFARTAGLNLDGTYTGKAFAALTAHRQQAQFDGPALFWCTLNAVDTPLAEIDALASLGEDFARYR